MARYSPAYAPLACVNAVSVGASAATARRTCTAVTRSVRATGEFTGGGIDQHALAAADVLRHHDLDAGRQLGRLRALGGSAALEFRRRLDDLDRNALRQLQR